MPVPPSSEGRPWKAIAETIVETGEYGRMTENGVRRELNRMPVYPYFLAGVFKVFGTSDLKAVVRVQIVVVLAMILGLALAATAIDRRIAVPTALIAAVIPNWWASAFKRFGPSSRAIRCAR